MQISQGQLCRGRQQLALYMQKFRNRLRGKNRIYVAQLMRLIDSISAYLDVKAAEPSCREGVADLSSVMAGKGVDQINMNKLIRYLLESKLARKVEGYMVLAEQEQSRRSQTSNSNGQTKPQSSDLPVLTHLQSFIGTLAYPDAEGRFFFEKDGDGEMLLKYTLLDPTHHFQNIVEDARAVVLAGGTMSPVNTLLSLFCSITRMTRLDG